MGADANLTSRVATIVMEGVSAEATRRSSEGLAALSDTARQALAAKLLRNELQNIELELQRQGVPTLGPAAEEELSAAVLAQATGLAQVELALSDATVEEVTAVKHDLWFTYHTDGSVRARPELGYQTDRELFEWLSFVARTKGRTERQFNAQNPLLVMRVGTGLRLAATCEVSQHTSFTLRRNTLGAVTVDELIDRQMFPVVVGDLLRGMVAAPEIRIVIVGATGAGKTTLSRAMLNELPPDFRLVVIEDTAELDLFDLVRHRNVESWEVREQNSEGQGEVSLSLLVKHGLRYRPDLLMLGETRDSDAAVPMLKAMTNGQASLTTVHAETAVAGLEKLALYLATGESTISLEKARFQLSQAVDFVIHVDRGSDGQRFITEILEVAGFEDDRVLTNPIFTSDGPGHGKTLGRTQRTSRKLQRGGFDATRLGGGFR